MGGNAKHVDHRDQRGDYDWTYRVELEKGTIQAIRQGCSYNSAYWERLKELIQKDKRHQRLDTVEDHDGSRVALAEHT